MADERANSVGRHKPIVPEPPPHREGGPTDHAEPGPGKASGAWEEPRPARGRLVLVRHNTPQKSWTLAPRTGARAAIARGFIRWCRVPRGPRGTVRPRGQERSGDTGTLRAAVAQPGQDSRRPHQAPRRRLAEGDVLDDPAAFDVLTRHSGIALASTDPEQHERLLAPLMDGLGRGPGGADR